LSGSFDFGVAFTIQEGLKIGHLYSEVTEWRTSYYYFENEAAVSGYGYGEAWINPNSGERENPIVGTIVGGTDRGTTGLIWNDLDPGTDPNNRVHLEISLDALGIPVGEAATIGLFLASANCANDIIYGEIDVSQVPIGSTGLLFGTGFLGLIRFWRRRR
jgi:hypothetical protein